MRRPVMDIPAYDAGNEKLPDAIAQMGYTSLRPGQSEPINCIMYGRDTICILPTGAGKSAIFAIPTIAMEWKTVVFSPLIALMRDQVQSMNRAGIRTGCVSSNQTDLQNYTILKEWADGKLQMLYVAPERLDNPQFRQAMLAVSPDLAVLDEAHTLSQWSATFRPAYCRCGDFIDEFNPKVVAAFTATATHQVVDDVRRVLRIPEACICRHYPPRENLHLTSTVLKDDDQLHPEVLRKVREVKGSCIVYCQTVKQVQELTVYLSQAGESVTFYHGQITENNLKDMNQDEFMSGRERICVATNAFGMGIDKPDIEGVIHVGPPGSVEAISQETGRAARDGRDAICHMFSSPGGLSIQEFFWNLSHPDSGAVKAAYEYLRRASNSDGVAYVTNKELCAHVESSAAEGALNYLQSCGCVERFKPAARLYSFILTSNDTFVHNLGKTPGRLYAAISEGGVQSGTDDETGSPIYQVDIAWLVAQLGVAESTVRSHIRQLEKDGYLRFSPPFNGKATKLVRAPSADDLKLADIKRAIEYEKLLDVRKYIATPDKDKQEFLQSYFALS